MIIDIISDLHGFFPVLEGGDLLIVAGDLTASDKPIQYGEFAAWMDRQKYKKKILIAGNHDNFYEKKGFEEIQDAYKSINEDYFYLCDSGTEFEGLKIWGSPWTAQFKGINPQCCAFTVRHFDHTDELLGEYWKNIPSDTDILITHCPPFGIFDKVKNYKNGIGGRAPKYVETGSVSLRNHVMDRIKPKIHCFGHIHEWGGNVLDTTVTKFINASHVNEYYEPVNKPVRIIL